MKKFLIFFSIILMGLALIGVRYFEKYTEMPNLDAIEAHTTTGTITGTKVIPAYQKTVSVGSGGHRRVQTIPVPEQYQFSVHMNELNKDGTYSGVSADQFAVGDKVTVTYKYVQLPLRSKESMVITQLRKQ